MSLHRRCRSSHLFCSYCSVFYSALHVFDIHDCNVDCRDPNGELVLQLASWLALLHRHR